MSDATVAVPLATVWAGPDAPRAVDAPAVADRPDPGAWLAAMGLEDRLGLLGRVETQALLGEPARVLDERDGWALVELPHQPSRKSPGGYPGWVRCAHLLPGGPGGQGADTVTVTARLARAASPGGGEVVLSCGTRLLAEATFPDRVVVRAPDGALLDLPAVATAPITASGESLVDAARGFRGLPYLWGGCGGWGVDCSGLTHLAHRSAGVTIPRDADDQAAAGTGVPAGSTVAGDLLFFARPGEEPHHVAFRAGAGRMLHSPRTGRDVEEIPAAAEPYRSELQPVARRYT